MTRELINYLILGKFAIGSYQKVFQIKKCEGYLMTTDQISILTSLLCTLVGTSATIIGFIFVVYTFVMLNRKNTRSDKKDQKDEGYIMFVTLFNLAIPLLIALYFLTLFTFKLMNLSDNGIIELDYLSLIYLIFISLSIVIVNGMLYFGLNKYIFVRTISLLVIIITLLLIITNLVILGVFDISLALSIIFMIFIMVITLLQIWVFLRTRDTYRINEN